MWHLPTHVAKALCPVRIALALENLWKCPATQAYSKFLAALLNLYLPPVMTWVGRHALALVPALLQTAAPRRMPRTSSHSMRGMQGWTMAIETS